MVTPNNPVKYRGTDVYLANIVTRDRPPTLADYRQPETGRNYVIFCGWQVGKNPTSGVEGDLWLLSKIVGNQGYWVKVASGVVPTAGVLTLSDTANTLVFPTALGNIQLLGTAGEIDVTSDAINNRIIFSLPGGGGAIDSVMVQANTSPGVNPVLPTALGLITVNGAVVAAHSVPLETRSRALNTYNIEAQIASLVSPTPGNSNSVGMACFNTNQFTLDATSGMVSLKGSTTGAPILTITGDTGGAEVPDSVGNFNVKGTASQVIVTGSANTETISLYGGASVSAFWAYSNTDLNNVTGDNTVYNIILNSTRYNVGSNYNTGTGVYTAPKAGKYLFTFTGLCKGLAPTFTTGKLIFLYNGTEQYAGFRGDYGIFPDAGDNFQISFSMMFDMVANDTMQVLYQVNGGTKVVGLFGLDPTAVTFFTGMLLP